MNVTILGAGTMASALTVPLTENGHRVKLWGTRFDREILEKISSGEAHPRLEKSLSTAIQIFDPDEIEASLNDTDLVLLGVSSKGVVPVLRKAVDYIHDHQILLTIAKGVLSTEDDEFFMHEGIKHLFNEAGVPTPEIVLVAGPSIAAELADRRLTPVDFPGESRKAVETCADVLETDYYRIQPTTDIRGTEICLGLKNIYSIALSWPKGLSKISKGSSMSNARSLLFMIAVDELKRLTEEAGGNPRTALGRPGLGDFVTTSESGRNGMFGRLLGEGHNVDEALEILAKRGVGVVEGFETGKPAMKLVRDLELEGPLSQEYPLLLEIHRVLYEEKPVDHALDDLIQTVEETTDL